MSGKVSVIIPAFNAENYIQLCIKSVFEQSYDNLQIIVVDDGSTDETLQLVKYYAEKDSRIVSLHKEKGGVSSARNMGLSRADGEYIAFLDADDTMEPNAIAVLVTEIEKHRADWVSCQYSMWGEHGDHLDDYAFISGKRIFSSDEDRYIFLVNEYLNYKVGYEVWNKLYRADIIHNNHLSFSERIKIGEDQAFNIKYLMHAKNLYCLPDRVIRHRIRKDSAMGGGIDVSCSINEDILVLEDVWRHAVEIGNSVFEDNFTLILCKLLEHSYIGHNCDEIVHCFKSANEVDFVREHYRGLDRLKDEMLSISPKEIAKIKYRYHMLIKGKLCGESLLDTVGRLIYDCYRLLRKKEVIGKWKMPY